MFRGLELVVRNRDPREAWYWLQRICSVCTVVHALASVRAVEDALQIEVPDNARLVRNLIASAQLVQDHVVHFYHLQALDWAVSYTHLGAVSADGRSLSPRYFPNRVAAGIGDKHIPGRIHRHAGRRTEFSHRGDGALGRHRCV